MTIRQESGARRRRSRPLLSRLFLGRSGVVEREEQSSDRSGHSAPASHGSRRGRELGEAASSAEAGIRSAELLAFILLIVWALSLAFSRRPALL